MTSTQIFLLLLQWSFRALFVGTLFFGGYLALNRVRLFGEDPDVPGDGTSARAYNAMQVFAVWVHAVVLSGAFALGFH